MRDTDLGYPFLDSVFVVAFTLTGGMSPAVFTCLVRLGLPGSQGPPNLALALYVIKFRQFCTIAQNLH